ncbi:ATP-binding cassette domain-containing protein [bacterium]|jgi:phospholipid/cholesterol/gamma-HCH transport system ATP-binding protein|nr:ATP-binding cassette domain-containing protein [bacterium]
MIRANDASLRFKDRCILEHLNFHIAPREAFSIIGPSGAGKSVLLKMMAGLLPPSTGSITVDSVKISMLFQKNALFDSMNLLQNLLVPLAETCRVRGSEAEDRSMALLKAVGLDHAALLHPDEISGGMQKRLGIARALIIDPEVILYDEPTAGLDPITSRSIAELMIELHEKNRTTLVMVTNDLQRAYQVSSRIAFCHDQRLVDYGSPAEVKTTTDPVLRHFIYSNAITSKGTTAQ